ncbi:MAG: hypothetical protein ACJ74U_07030 [Jatrophihabitantaceae bacterium]
MTVRPALMPESAADGAARLPVEVHCHGFGDVDFSEFDRLDLRRLDRAAAAESVVCVPTLYLHRHRLGSLQRFMQEFAALRALGEIPHVVGIALEGPLLASHGGTPASTVWQPTFGEWLQIAALGRLGLLYTVLSPDAFTPGSPFAVEDPGSPRRFEDIVPVLVEHGVRPSLGHFLRDDPPRSAEAVYRIVELAWSASWGGTGLRVTTDHLFNDMPLTIRHAFRTSRARRDRDATIASYQLRCWTLDGLAEQVGPVPAAIMNLAAAGRLAACINFDGEHVDLEVAATAVRLMGVENSMLMTDRCDSARLGGQLLHHEPENTLWYQDGGTVAAGSQPMARQLHNARRIGLTEQEIGQLAADTAYRVFDIPALLPE